MQQVQKTNRQYLHMKRDEYRYRFMDIANKEVFGKFEINSHNKVVIDQIYYYLRGMKKFNGDVTKGLLLIGGYGTGKTTLIKIIQQLINENWNKVWTMVSCVNLAEIMKEREVEFYKKRPLILDEIGRESQVVKDFGTERRYVPEILSMRYNERSWTMGTSNYDTEALKKMYGGYIEDRLHEMFNIIQLTGKSFRK